MIKYKNGEVYTGNFREGLKFIGRHTMVDGSFYEGMFKDNIPHGSG